MTKLELVGVCAALLGVACSSDRKERLRAALDQAQLPLSASVGIAEQSEPQAVGVKAELLVDRDPVYAVGAIATGKLRDVRVDIVEGRVLATLEKGSSDVPCPGSIGLADAIAIAEKAVGGSAVSIAPDDDDACHREVQVLSGDTLFEVKVGRDGTVIEIEFSDDD